MRDDDTSTLVGGPITRYGGKGINAPRLLPHFAPAKVYVEPFFGAGGMFFRVPPGTYEREAVNDLDASLVTFFRALRDQPDELARVIEATPYARDEFIAALEHSPDALEEARRVWVRGRQGFGGKASCAGDWGRNPGATVPWLPAGGVVVAENAFRSAARNRLLARDPLMSEDEAVMVGFAQLAAIAGLWGRGEADVRLVAEVRGAQELARATRAYLVRVVRTVPGVRAELPFELALDREWNVNRNLLVLEGEHPYAPQLRVTSRRTEGALTVLEGASEGGFPRTVLLHSSLEV